MHHELIAALPKPQQRRWLKRAEKEGWSCQELRKNIRDAGRETRTLPAGKYRVIYADPPWKYNDEQQQGGYGPAENHYPTLTTEELCELPIPDLCHAEAVLFMWATVPLLPDALRIVDFWGFEYKTHFVWDKVKHNYGHYSSVRHELLILATRGSCLPDNAQLFNSVVRIERSNKHSEKPERFREIIEALYPKGSRIELFARKKQAGWSTWGNE